MIFLATKLCCRVGTIAEFPPGRIYYEALQMKRLPTIRTRRPRKLRAMALTMLWVIDRRAGLRLGPLRD